MEDRKEKNEKQQAGLDVCLAKIMTDFEINSLRRGL
jgi:hypothetical protein